MRTTQRYARLAPGYDVLSGEWPIYRAGRTTGIGALRLGQGAVVVDIGCGTGLSFPLLRRAIGSSGCIVGVDASPDMLARARAKIARRGWDNIDLVCADATDLPHGWLGARLGRLRGLEGADAILFTYSLSLMKNWPDAWRAAVAAARPGARVAVVDMEAPAGAATVFTPLARLACALGGSDIKAHPWTSLETDCSDVQAWSLRGGHIQVRAGTVTSANRDRRHAQHFHGG